MRSLVPPSFLLYCMHLWQLLNCLLYSNFLVNSSDWVIRVYDIEEIMKSKEGEAEALQRLQDLVNRQVHCVHVNHFPNPTLRKWTMHTIMYTCKDNTCTRIHTHSHTFTHMHTHSHTFTHIHTHAYLHHMYTHIQTFTHIHTHVHTFIHMHTCAHLHNTAHTHKPVNMQKMNFLFLSPLPLSPEHSGRNVPFQVMGRSLLLGHIGSMHCTYGTRGLAPLLRCSLDRRGKPCWTLQ